MKKFYIIILLSFISFCNSQIVNIPDFNFKAKLLSADVTNTVALNAINQAIKIDTNNDGEIQTSEILNIHTLNVPSSNIGSLSGIENFTYLNYFNCDNNLLTALNLSGNHYLKKVSAKDNSLTSFASLNFQNVNNLEELDLSNNNISSPNITSLEHIYNLKLNLTNNQLTSLNLQNTYFNTVNISSNNFSTLALQCNYLYKIIASDNANLTNIDLTGTPNLTEFAIWNTNPITVTNFNLTGLTSLNTLQLTNVYLSGINLSSQSSLVGLTLDRTNLISIDLSNLTNLQSLTIAAQNITTLNLNNLINLNFLFLRDLPISNINISTLINLYTISFTGNPNLTNIDFSNNPLLTNVALSDNNLNNLVLDNKQNLISVFANKNNLQNISLNGSQNNLKTLYLSENNFSSFSNFNLPFLENLTISYNPIATIDFSTFPKLKNLHCGSTNLTTLDLSSNSELVEFYPELMPNLTSINIKNGQKQYYMSFYGSSNLKYICLDDVDITNVQNKLALAGLTNVVFNSYCSFTPGGTFYTIQGNTKYDINNSGCDVSDPKKAFQKFDITNGTVSGSIISNSLGEYSIPVQVGSHTISPVLENPTYFNISPTAFMANFPTQTSPLNQNFCLTANGNHNDLEIVILPLNAARPGFVSEYKVLFKNKGTATQVGNFSFTYDDNLMNLLSTSLATSSQSFGVLNYNFTNLLPFQTRVLTVKFTLNTPTATPPLNGNDILNYTAQINGATDETPLDNTFTLNQTVVNSFDPNDKTCLEGTQITQTKVGDYVHYLIRFENTGTATAENIVVKDMIDTSKFDINSLVALSGSDSFVTRITNPNTVEFIFENIQLPFNDLYNDGYVSFKIKTKSTLVLGDSFSNTANIYFDYNAPIVTNTATTTVANLLATSELITGKNQIEFYPNPVVDIIKFNGEENVLKIEIFDASGRIMTSKSVKNNEANLTDLQTGNYFLKIYTKDQYYVNKMMKK